jgi:outer membrane protein OmpA-like peptidoglycan-associated protein
MRFRLGLIGLTLLLSTLEKGTEEGRAKNRRVELVKQ